MVVNFFFMNYNLYNTYIVGNIHYLSILYRQLNYMNYRIIDLSVSTLGVFSTLTISGVIMHMVTGETLLL